MLSSPDILFLMEELQTYFCNFFFPLESFPLKALTCFDLALLQDLMRLQPKGTWLQGKEQIKRLQSYSAVKGRLSSKASSWESPNTIWASKGKVCKSKSSTYPQGTGQVNRYWNAYHKASIFKNNASQVRFHLEMSLSKGKHEHERLHKKYFLLCLQEFWVYR